MKKLLCSIAAVMIFCGTSSGASSSELKRMSTFINNFTEVGMNEIDIDDVSDSELAYFGVWHNWKNNYKTRIKQCTKKNCPYGRFIIDKKYVAESVKKFFDLELDHTDAGDGGTLGHYDGRYYHFDGASSESVQARVRNVQKLKKRTEAQESNHHDWPDI